MLARNLVHLPLALQLTASRVAIGGPESVASKRNPLNHGGEVGGGNLLLRSVSESEMQLCGLGSGGRGRFHVMLGRTNSPQSMRNLCPPLAPGPACTGARCPSRQGRQGRGRRWCGPRSRPQGSAPRSWRSLAGRPATTLPGFGGRARTANSPYWLRRSVDAQSAPMRTLP